METPKEFGLKLEEEYTTLYCRDKRKKVRVFECKVYETPAKTGLIITRTGGFGNKLVEKKRKVLKGKNIGRSNATTPIEQAVKEGLALCVKKAAEGYKDLYTVGKLSKFFEDTIYSKDPNGLLPYLMEYLPEFNTDDNNNPKPMLAEKWSGKHSFPVYVQAKYNGVRCFTFMKDDKLVTLSREGTYYSVPHLHTELASLMGIAYNMGLTDIVLDGELYLHGAALQDIASLVKTPGLLSGGLTYEVYDIAFRSGGGLYSQQFERVRIRQQLFEEHKRHSISSSVRFVATPIAENLGEIKALHRDNIKNGFEGSIVRPNNKTYMFGFRDNALQKIKETVSEEYLIVNWSWNPSQPHSDFTFTCVTPEGKQFDVKPHGTVEQREKMYMNIDSFVGKYLQLTFHEYTNAKIPFHITEVTVRDYE